MKLLKSFEDFIFEAASWLIFYPLTLGRIMLHPLKTMEYSDREQTEDTDHRYDDALSPPLLLMVTILLSNLISAAAHIAPPDATTAMLKTITATQQNLTLFRTLLFSLIPLIAASSLVRRQGKKLSRQTLRPPFYAQCYLAAFCAAFVAVGDVFLRRPELSNAVGATIICGGVLWFLAVQSTWFARKLNIPRIKAAGIAVWATLRAIVYMLLVVIPIAYV
ncbi:hypothetical protein [Brevundimonas bullata]